VPLTSPCFVDNANGTITDTVTGLIWLKQADCVPGNWGDAISAIGSLADGQCGLSDGSAPGAWRMPNRNELQSLSDRMENNHTDYFNQTYIRRYNDALSQSPIFTNFRVSTFYNVPKTNVGFAIAVC